jgi:hypothetical protein
VVEVPERVQELLEDYVEAGSRGIANLAGDVRQPALVWFPAEFERLLRAGAFTPQWWGRALYRDEWTEKQTPNSPATFTRSGPR